MTDFVVPTLDMAGFVEDTEKRADRLFTYAFVSLFSQSNEYRGKITSIPYILQQAGDNLTTFLTDLRSALTTYLKRYFTQVEMQITSAPAANLPGQIDVRFDITVKGEKDEQPYNFVKLRSINNGKFINFVNAVNAE